MRARRSPHDHAMRHIANHSVAVLLHRCCRHLDHVSCNRHDQRRRTDFTICQRCDKFCRGSHIKGGFPGIRHRDQFRSRRRCCACHNVRPADDRNMARFAAPDCSEVIDLITPGPHHRHKSAALQSERRVFQQHQQRFSATLPCELQRDQRSRPVNWCRFAFRPMPVRPAGRNGHQRPQGGNR